MKSLLTFLVLSLFIFNWIGYQLYTSVHEENFERHLTDSRDKKDSPESTLIAAKLPAVHFTLFVKDVDFDDLFEFTAAPGYSANEIFFDLSENLFLNHENKGNRPGSFKCFNGEYYSSPCNLYTKYPDAYSSGKIPDRYLLKIPFVFPDLQDHPPQHIG